MGISMSDNSCLDAEKAALRLIARAEQCSSGLSRKLEKRGFDSACINEVISRLNKINLLDDNRFARFWIRSRLRFGRSPRQLLSSLCSRGINHDDAESALKSILDEETELSLLESFITKHVLKTDRKKNKNKEDSRSIKYLLRNEGFSTQIIQQYLDE
ncbi:MAG: recombination regulator RecX [Treponema sp.]|nr:recombination regulator RecX [Treponema sp.]